jgi:hypothetical protein
MAVEPPETQLDEAVEVTDATELVERVLGAKQS